MPQTNAVATVAPITITLKRDKECKGSVRYVTDEPDAVVTNVYLSRSAFNPMPDAITITVKSN